ncbi:alanyl-tRNA editing protein AlaX [Acidianus sulfidivorans JP7]|uniref:Alanyl-tRNA editing protein AlaX n=1 Tax=Acidianus sulfidivorans JP7 TaxID=619593 RepID=A0A2U9IN63_9CREN|nr:alanyl-tRNA editing protein AlaXM [Acidianus sulfidivorans]AWR97451.1 alanyl-tRNA editing protein AlaX [Acidianus sulfidivorans JP7]
MTEELYLKDSYLKDFKAKIVNVRANEIILDKTAFYPGGGGLENDIGKILFNGKDYIVKNVKRGENSEIIHELESTEGLKVGDEITGIIDWQRRYNMMRLHTASHIMAAIAFSKYNALVTGGHISPEYAKDDFNLESKDQIYEIVKEANDVISRSIEVKVYFLPREEALKIPGIVKLAGRNPPNIEIWRIVEIPGIDIQADGGPHVKNTSEIGKIEIIKIENKGKKQKRVYYKLA